MFNERFYALGAFRSVIRELYEYGKIRKAEIGDDKVFDFSLGNPSIAPPESVNKSIINLVKTKTPTALHGYTSAQGDAGVRKAISDNITDRFGVEMSPNLIYITCGAAASLTITLGALCSKGDKVLALAPYFPDYKVFAETSGASFNVVKPLDDMSFDLCDLEEKIDQTVKVVIINSPNNPSGVVYTEQQIEALCNVLRKKSKQYNSRIFLIADEPYREITYGAEVPYLMNFYDDTVVCYSYSKLLSLAGERIGYIAINPKMQNAHDLYLAVCGAGRAYGYVCAPSLFQFVVGENVSAKALVEKYQENRDILCSALSEIGYEFSRPDGAFYLFVKSPSGDSVEFCERAKRHEILIVSGVGFGAPTHARVSYCVTKQQILNSLDAFRALMNEYKN